MVGARSVDISVGALVGDDRDDLAFLLEDASIECEWVDEAMLLVPATAEHHVPRAELHRSRMTNAENEEQSG